MTNPAKRLRSTALVATASLSFLSLPSGFSQAPASPPKGTLMIVGGGGRGEDVMRRFVDLAGGRGKAVIAVVPMASGDAPGTGKEMAAELDSLGARSYVVLVKRPDADKPSVARSLDSATGVWFTGGDQDLLTAAIGGTATQRAIQARYRAGAVVGGTSAGAAVMSDSMITGNQTPPGDTTGYYGDDFPAISRHRIQITPGLGFLSNAIVDQHFIKRERHNRLISAVLEHPSLIGVGIDENTALEVRPDGTWRVLGESAVVIYDARKAKVTPDSRPVLGVTEMRMHIVPTGGAYDPTTGRVLNPGA
jgi:cyanophycinase